MNIPDKAVEAATSAVRSNVHVDLEAEHLIAGFIRKALEAAAPHMSQSFRSRNNSDMAEAWDAGVKAERQWRIQFARGGNPADPPNPHRPAR